MDAIRALPLESARESIVQARDVAAKIETRNFGNQRIYYDTSRLMRLSLNFSFFIELAVYKIKIRKTIFFSVENQNVFLLQLAKTRAIGNGTS